MENAFLKKLRVKSQNSVLVLNQPADANEIFGDIPNDINWISRNGRDFDALIIFATTKSELNQALKLYQDQIKEQTLVWIFYPKATSKLAGDLNLMKSWEDLKQHQLEPCASAAVDEDWTGIRLKVMGTTKKSGLANQDIAQNEFGQYIDVNSKTVTLPKDLLDVLSQDAQASSFFERLAYSHQKEYVLWIVTAKQEKTRVARIAKMLDMLKKNKKNPSEK